MSRQFATIYDIFCPVPFLPSPFGFRRLSRTFTGCAEECSPTDPFDTGDELEPSSITAMAPMANPSAPLLLMISFPIELSEHYLIALTPAGIRSVSWRWDDEVAWLLLMAGFHPYAHVLCAVCFL